MSRELHNLASEQGLTLEQIPKDKLPPVKPKDQEKLEVAQKDLDQVRAAINDLELELRQYTRNKLDFYNSGDWFYYKSVSKPGRRLDQHQKSKVEKTILIDKQLQDKEAELHAREVELLDQDNYFQGVLDLLKRKIFDTRVKAYLAALKKSKRSKNKKSLDNQDIEPEERNTTTKQEGKENLPNILVGAEVHTDPEYSSDSDSEVLEGAVGGEPKQRPLPDPPVQEDLSEPEYQELPVEVNKAINNNHPVLPVQEVQVEDKGLPVQVVQPVHQPVQVGAPEVQTPPVQVGEINRDIVGNLPNQNFQPELPLRDIEGEEINLDRVVDFDIDREAENRANRRNRIRQNRVNRNRERQQRIDRRIPDIFRENLNFENLFEPQPQVANMAFIPDGSLHHGKAFLNEFGGEINENPHDHMTHFYDWLLTGFGINAQGDLQAVAAAGGIPAYHQANIVIPHFRRSLKGVAREWYRSEYGNDGPYDHATWARIRTAFINRFDQSGTTEYDRLSQWVNFANTWDASKESVDKMMVRLKDIGRRMNPQATVPQYRIMLIQAIVRNDPSLEEDLIRIADINDIMDMIRRRQNKKMMKSKPVVDFTQTTEAASPATFLAQLDFMGKQEKLLAGVMEQTRQNSEQQQRIQEDLALVTEEMRNLNTRSRGRERDRRDSKPRDQTPYRSSSGGRSDRSQSRDRYRGRSFERGFQRGYDSGRNRNFRPRSQSRDGSRDRSQSRDRNRYDGNNRSGNRQNNRDNRKGERRSGPFCSHCSKDGDGYGHWPKDCYKLEELFKNRGGNNGRRVSFDTRPRRDRSQEDRDRSYNRENRYRNDRDTAYAMPEYPDIYEYFQRQLENSTNI